MLISGKFVESLIQLMAEYGYTNACAPNMPRERAYLDVLQTLMEAHSELMPKLIYNPEKLQIELWQVFPNKEGVGSVERLVTSWAVQYDSIKKVKRIDVDSSDKCEVIACIRPRGHKNIHIDCDGRRIIDVGIDCETEGCCMALGHPGGCVDREGNVLSYF